MYMKFNTDQIYCTKLDRYSRQQQTSTQPLKLFPNIYHWPPQKPCIGPIPFCLYFSLKLFLLLKTTAFWDTALCNLSEVDSHFRVVYTINAPTMEAVRTSEMLVYFGKTTWYYIPQGCHLQTRCHENPKSHIFTHHGGAWEERYSSGSILTWTLHRGGWLAPWPGRSLPLGKDPWYPPDRKLGGPKSPSGCTG